MRIGIDFKAINGERGGKEGYARERRESNCFGKCLGGL
jgi:hypothetical protein